MIQSIVDVTTSGTVDQGARPTAGDHGGADGGVAGQALGLDIDAAGLGVGGADAVFQPGDGVLDLGGA